MSINHTVRRTGSGDYACSCGQTWDYDEGVECPATVVHKVRRLEGIRGSVVQFAELPPAPRPSEVEPPEWECSHRRFELPVSFMRKVLVALKQPHDTDNRLAVIATIEHLLSQVPE